MSSEIDPAKLKVVDLRHELSTRGLDTKGNKAVLVKRLKDALEQEFNKELPDSSIADTSTEDLSSSQIKDDAENLHVSDPEDKPHKQIEEPMETEGVDQPEPQLEAQPDIAEQGTVDDHDTSLKLNLENGNHSETAKENKDETEKNTIPDNLDEHNQELENKPQIAKDERQEARGDKRKRGISSPERSQRRRSKTPIKEDEPVVDNNKVQLSWYDSDLHLQIDKDGFLSARPFHEGAFGYVWAGVRATHGACNGKVYFEVKITEELKWEDLAKQQDRNRRDRNKSQKDSRSERKKEETKKEDTQKEDAQKEDTQDGSEIEKEKPAIVTIGEEPAENCGKESKELQTSEVVGENEEHSEQENTNEGGKMEELVNEKNTNDFKDEIVEIKEDKDTKEGDIKEEKMDTDELKFEPVPPHCFRVGWSLLNTDLQLGECKHSFAYESTGKFITNNIFSDYGRKYGVGDVIASFVNIVADSVSITYTVNGTVQPVAIVLPRSEFPEEGFALFPHVLSRNYAFEFNLGFREEPWFSLSETLSDYVFVDKMEERISGPIRPENRNECEVIMMCGLPASGKTHWVREWIEKNPEKRYTIIGSTYLLERMTVNGNALKNSYKSRWNIILDKLQKCLNRLVEVAALRRRNYIIDQTNVFSSAQRRKMRPFEGFKRRAVVVVVGNEEQAKRQALQEAEDGKDVPDSAVLEMKANMSLPRVCDWIESVEYSDLGEEEAKAIIKEYNAQGREAGFGNDRKDYRNDRSKWYNRRPDYRSGNYRDKNYHTGRYDRNPRGGWQNQRPGGSNWNRNDRRDTRGGSRDWRSNRGNDRDGSRNQSSSYNRNRNNSGNRNQGNYGHGWNQGSGYGQGNWQGNWGSQNPWKYGHSYQGYGGNYPNYYYGGQYQQNWNNSQGK